MPNHDSQIVTVLGVGRSPNVLEQLLLGDDPPRMPRQLRQHRVLLTGQRNFGALEQYPAIGQVHGEWTEGQCRLLSLAHWRLA